MRTSATSTMPWRRAETSNGASATARRARQAWRGMSRRERWLVLVATSAVVLALLWGLALAPALRILRTAPAQLDALDTQLLSMQRLAAQARAIQTRPPMAREESLRALDASVRQRLGPTAQLRVVGDRATLVVQATSSEALAAWLGQVRATARAVPSQAQLKRNPAGWEGTVVLDLPPP